MTGLTKPETLSNKHQAATFIHVETKAMEANLSRGLCSMQTCNGFVCYGGG